ncbi:MAG: hypothetical protein C4297_10410 [Gemmataceae bacterium]
MPKWGKPVNSRCKQEPSRGNCSTNAWLLIVTICTLAGCRQTTVLPDPSPAVYGKGLLDLESQGKPGDLELATAGDAGDVTTVLSPEGKQRPITLAECIALALENGRTGEFFDRTGSRRSSLSPTVRGAPASNLTDSIRVFAYDPAVAALDIEIALAKFDARWQTSMTWSKTDEPQALQAVFFGREATLQRDQAQFQTQLLKPLPTGGVAGITFRTDYDFSNINARIGRVNPAYTPRLEFSFEQPLLQGFGVQINQLRNSHPGSIRTPFATGGRVPGILIARLFNDEQQLEFERRVQDLLLSVEEAYWELYCAYWDLYSREMGMRQAHAAWQVVKRKYEAGQVPIQDVAQIEQQFQLFRAQRLQALGQGTARLGVLEAERRLRYLIGLPAEDGTRLIPVDQPTVAPYKPDWAMSVQQAMNRRPELLQARKEVQAAYLAVLREKDALLPDLRAFATYDINAIGSRLDGDSPANALKGLSQNDFNDWTLGLRLDIPLGYREAHAEVRRAKLQLAQRVTLLQDQEQKVLLSLQRSYRELVQAYELIRIQRARREAAATQLESMYQLFLAGKQTVDVLLEAQRNWADALRDEHFAICDYNIALAEFERQKGTILEHDNVSIVEGPIPASAQARASAHIRERARSIPIGWPATLAEEDPSATRGPADMPSAADPPALPLVPAVPSIPSGMPQGTEPAEPVPPPFDQQVP